MCLLEDPLQSAAGGPYVQYIQNYNHRVNLKSFAKNLVKYFLLLFHFFWRFMLSSYKINMLLIIKFAWVLHRKPCKGWIIPKSIDNP